MPLQKMSHNYNEEELLGQLQLALVPVSNSFPTFNVRDAYWEFLDRALHSTLRFVGIANTRLFICMCGIVGGCGNRNRNRNRNRTGGAPRLMGFSTNTPFKVPESPKSQCIMCFDDLASSIKTLDLQNQLPSGIACPRNHLICRGCLDSLIIQHCNLVLHTPSTPSQVNCPSCLAARSLRLFDLFSQRQSSAIAVSSYTQEQLKHACGGASKTALELLESVAQADQKLATLPESEQITNGNTDCYLCPKCKFGPVAHQACSDLLVHHGSQGVSNKCPKCGFLGSHISEWIQIAEPRVPTLFPHRTGHLLDAFVWEEFERRPRNLRENHWLPRVSGFHHAPDAFEVIHLRNRLAHRNPGIIPSLLPAAQAIEYLMQRQVGASFQLHVDPSYWDAPMRRLMQAAWDAVATAQAGNFTLIAVAPDSIHSTLTISDGSERYVVEELSHVGSWGRAHSDARQVSLAQESHMCLRVTCADNLQSISKWLTRDRIETALCSFSRHAKFQRRTQNCQMPLAWDAQLFVWLFEKAFAASVRSTNTRMAIKNGSETNGMESQLEMKREKQLACTRVV
jgi:hypothetical protein